MSPCYIVSDPLPYSSVLGYGIHGLLSTDWRPLWTSYRMIAGNTHGYIIDAIVRSCVSSHSLCVANDLINRLSMMLYVASRVCCGCGM